MAGASTANYWIRVEVQSGSITVIPSTVVAYRHVWIFCSSLPHINYSLVNVDIKLLNVTLLITAIVAIMRHNNIFNNSILATQAMIIAVFTCEPTN